MDTVKPGPARRDKTSPFMKRGKAEPRLVDPLTGEITGEQEKVSDRAPYTMGVNSLTIDRPLTFDEWNGLVDQLRVMEGAYQWWIGDTLNYGEAAYGEKYANAVNERQAETWRKYANVCARYQIGTRVPILSWSHHRAVAYVEEPRRSQLLKRAVKEGLSYRELEKLAQPGPTGKDSDKGDPPVGMTFHPLYIEGARSLVVPRLNAILAEYDENAVIHVDYYVVGDTRKEELP